MNQTWRKAAALAATSSSALLAAVAGCTPGNQYVAPPPPEVTVSPPLQRAVKTYVPYTGTTKASEQVELRARVRGFLKELHFKDGDDVKAGQLLMVIDEEPFKVRVREAQAQLDAAEAELKKAETSKSREVAVAQVSIDEALLALAQVEERRNRSLLVRNAASREDVDRTEAARKKSEAQLDADKANLEQTRTDFDINILAARSKVEGAKADLENAKIDLSYCRITSPIDGRMTRRAVDIGNLVGPAAGTDATTVLAIVVKTSPIYAYVSVSDADVLRFRSLVSQGKRADFRKESVPVGLGLSSESGYPHTGTLDYVDPGADPGTGTVQARAVFANKDEVILPGLFVRTRVPLDDLPNALLLPERAIGSDQSGRYVLLVGKDNKVEQRAVQPGDRTDDGLRIINEGLTADDLVVIDGLQYARPGQPVAPKMIEPSALAPRGGPAPETKTAPSPGVKKEGPAPEKSAPGAEPDAR